MYTNAIIDMTNIAHNDTIASAEGGAISGGGKDANEAYMKNCAGNIPSMNPSI